MKTLEIRGKKISLHAFFPDATKGYVRAVSSKDLEECKISGVVVNTYHLFKEDLIEKIKKSGGIHKYMKFNGIIISDSGGFQVMSLIRKDKKLGQLTNNYAVFTLDKKRIILTPEKCIKLQFDIGSDIIMCLDDCTQPDMPYDEQEKSVERTIWWAKRCKAEFERLSAKMPQEKKPLIFGIIQGGNNKELRSKCAEELIKIGFDGYSFGGWPIDNNGKFLPEILEYTLSLMPKNSLKYAMGVGKPENIVKCAKMGYDLFDCVIPTREARNNRLYAFKSRLFWSKSIHKNNFYSYVRIKSSKYEKDKKPISDLCSCYACKNFSKAEICRMFKEKNPESIRLATIHNLKFYSELMEKLQK